MVFYVRRNVNQDAERLRTVNGGSSLDVGRRLVRSSGNSPACFSSFCHFYRFLLLIAPMKDKKTPLARLAKPPDKRKADDMAMRDALLDAVRIEAAGVDITNWKPQLPPEMRRRRRK
jgi:hypothetical protein